MGKVLHASYSGYFPFCIEQGTPSSLQENLSLTLLGAMTLFWRVKKWEVALGGELNYTYPEGTFLPGLVQSITYPNDSFFVCETRGTNIATEEDFVCVQDADNFIFASIGRIPNIISFYQSEYFPYPPMDNSFIQFFGLRFTTNDRIKTSGSNFFVRFESMVSVPSVIVGTKDLENFPEMSKIVGSYSISFGDFTKNGILYGTADGEAQRDGSISGDVSLQIRAKEYWSYGGTYNTETGQPL
jgi:hypothetical protein